MKQIVVGVVCIGMGNFEARSYRMHERTHEVFGLLPQKVTDKAQFLQYPHLVESEQQADQCRAWFLADSQKPVDFLIIQASSLAMGDLMYPLFTICDRIGFWSVPEPTYDGDIRLNSFTGINLAVSIHRKSYQKEHPKAQCTWWHGWPGDSEFDTALACTIDAIHAKENLKHSRILQLGDTVPTFDNLTFNTQALQDSLGTEIITLDIAQLIKRIQDVTDSQGAEYASLIRQQASRVLVEDHWLLQTGKIMHAIHALRQEYQSQAVALRCWPEFQSELTVAPCVAVAALNENGIPTGCEGDAIGTLSMYTAWLITQKPVTMNDLVAYDTPSDAIQMWHCGPGPVSWADSEGQSIDYHHTLNRRKAPGEEPTGLSSDIVFQNGPVTVMRFNDDGNSMFTFESDIVTGPAKPYKGSGGWFSNITSNGTGYRAKDVLNTVMANGFEHHYPVARGHIEQVYREMAYWMNLSITPMQSWRPYAQQVKQ
jgi:L-fucose isomerase-like protein